MMGVQVHSTLFLMNLSTVKPTDFFIPEIVFFFSITPIQLLFIVFIHLLIFLIPSCMLSTSSIRSFDIIILVIVKLLV